MVIVQAGTSLLATAVVVPGKTGMVEAGLRAAEAAARAEDDIEAEEEEDAARALFSSCLASSCRRVLTTVTPGHQPLQSRTQVNPIQPERLTPDRVRSRTGHNPSDRCSPKMNERARLGTLCGGSAVGCRT